MGYETATPGKISVIHCSDQGGPWRGSHDVKWAQALPVLRLCTLPSLAPELWFNPMQLTHTAGQQQYQSHTAIKRLSFVCIASMRQACSHTCQAELCSPLLDGAAVAGLEAHVIKPQQQTRHWHISASATAAAAAIA